MKKNLILVDAHVHIHECFVIEKVLDSALGNFKKAYHRIGENSKFEGVLFLTETEGMNKYSQLQSYSSEKSNKKAIEIGSWKFYFTEETNCLRANRDDRQNIFIIAGRQIITAENLEVLALATTTNFMDGTPLKELIKQIIEIDGIPVIPWGVGKWLGKRGKFLKEFLILNKGSKIFLGDNGGRPSFWQNISHFQLASENGIRILRGTDPLPLMDEVKRIGSFGFMLSENLDVSKPSFHLKQLLQNKCTNLKNYGNLQNPIRFFRNQFYLKLNKLKKQ